MLCFDVFSPGLQFSAQVLADWEDCIIESIQKQNGQGANWTSKGRKHSNGGMKGASG
jgi:hypothetical protein